jgi:hypothetical protein
VLDASDITLKVQELRRRYANRDGNMSDIQAIRDGRIEEVAPDWFSDDVDKPIIANYIDIAARTTAETLAPLPAFNCSASNMSSDVARKFADKKTQGIQHYIETSNVQAQMYSGADNFISHGLMPAIIEPDFVGMVPRITLISPIGCYPETDRWGRLLSFTRVLRKTISELCNLYPSLARQICGPYLSPNSQSMLEIYIYHDKDQWSITVPERQNLVLSQWRNPLDEPCIAIAERPGVTEIPRGQYDDVIWIQLARNRFAMMAMEAAEQSVEAPMAVPYDVQEFAVGPMSTIRTNSPEKIRRVGMEMSPAAFQEGQLLTQELMQGARFPETRTGNLDASIITGQGVKALETGFNASNVASQEIIRKFFKDVIRICLKMDQTLWPDIERDIRGSANGVPYALRWKPSRDIADDYTCDVQYGFSMGMDPNRALVALLQMRGDHLISRDFTRRQFPFGINVSAEEAKIEVEELRTALLQSVAALSQSIPVLAQQGQDPSQILGQMGELIRLRQKGKSLEDAASQAFAPPPPSPEELAMQEQAQQQQMMGGQGQPALPPGPNAAGGGGNGMPMDLMSLISGLNGGGSPQTGVSVRRALPV